MRILVAFEDEYRTLREAIAQALGAMRPGDVVKGSGLEGFGAVLARFDPHLVVASVPDASEPGGTISWVELSADPGGPSRVRVGGRRSEASNPSLEDLARVAEETEGLIGAGRWPLTGRGRAWGAAP